VGSQILAAGLVDEVAMDVVPTLQLRPGLGPRRRYPKHMSVAADQQSPDRWARPGRLPVVAADLDRLHGPTSGRIDLPHRLFWQQQRTFDLDEPGVLGWVYQTVLAEARTQAELETWLDGPTLTRLWPQLYLPRGVRTAWQAVYPQLRRHAA
jgi:hypothetical protein